MGIYAYWLFAAMGLLSGLKKKAFGCWYFCWSVYFSLMITLIFAGELENLLLAMPKETHDYMYPLSFAVIFIASTKILYSVAVKLAGQDEVEAEISLNKWIEKLICAICGFFSAVMIYQCVLIMIFSCPVKNYVEKYLPFYSEEKQVLSRVKFFADLSGQETSKMVQKNLKKQMEKNFAVKEEKKPESEKEEKVEGKEKTEKIVEDLLEKNSSNTDASQSSNKSRKKSKKK